jgi:DNA-binding PadR family transcriptional regulator
MSRYLHISGVRRKAGALVPLELAICAAAADLRRQGTAEFHGYLIAKELKHAADARLLTAYGTLYRALGRLEQMGLLEGRWEDPQIPADENRPRRKLYSLTSNGEAAIADAAKTATPPARTRGRARKGWAPA